ncbi:MAG: 50S ribosomal protein L13 [Desulfurococcales archaeon ex4484_42]|nr:MAG: 50S ribosomal protein L13 [Desulfurococcales archaeon ex4484_42]
MSSKSKPALDRVIVIDAEGAILGRLASYVAKLLQEGFKVHVVNAEKAVLSGDPLMVIKSYQIWLKIRTLKNPQKHAPRRPRSPEMIIKKAVKGMLPKDNWKGFIALRNLKVHVGIPKELANKERIKIGDADVSRLARKFITVAEVAKAMGWKGYEYLSK